MKTEEEVMNMLRENYENSEGVARILKEKGIFYTLTMEYEDMLRNFRNLSPECFLPLINKYFLHNRTITLIAYGEWRKYKAIPITNLSYIIASETGIGEDKIQRMIYTLTAKGKIESIRVGRFNLVRPKDSEVVEEFEKKLIEGEL